LWGSDGTDDARVDPDDLVHEIEIRG
jgi:hypothetical protein